MLSLVMTIKGPILIGFDGGGGGRGREGFTSVALFCSKMGREAANYRAKDTINTGNLRRI
jgi:hypothetical protein